LRSTVEFRGKKKRPSLEGRETVEKRMRLGKGEKRCLFIPKKRGVQVPVFEHTGRKGIVSQRTRKRGGSLNVRGALKKEKDGNKCPHFLKKTVIHGSLAEYGKRGRGISGKGRKFSLKAFLERPPVESSGVNRPILRKRGKKRGG